MLTDKVFTAYVECALWSEMDQSEPNGGYPLDRNYSAADITADSLKEMRTELDEFCKLLPAGTCTQLEDEQVGHDFWLTRNRHGTGFWDRGLGELGRELTDLAHPYGEAHLYVGDDGQLHFFNG